MGVTISLPQWEDPSTLNSGLAELNHFVQGISKRFEARQGDNDNGVATTFHRFDDPQERPLRVLIQFKCEMLPLNVDIDAMMVRIHI